MKNAKPGPFSIFLVATCLLGLTAPASHTTAATFNKFSKRFVFFTKSARNSSDLQKAISVIKRSKAAGYNGLLTQIYSFYMKDMSPTLKANTDQMIAEMKKNNLAIVPNYFGQTVPNIFDMNNAEAFPVKGTQFKATNGVGELVPRTTPAFVNPGFEEKNGPMPTGWRVYLAAPGVNLNFDETVKKEGAFSMRFDNPPANSSLEQRFKGLKPHTAYLVSAWVKTENFDQYRDVGFRVTGADNVPLINFSYKPAMLGVAQTMNWRRCGMDFNTMTNTSVKVNLSPTSMGRNATGKVWFDGVTIEEVGLYETVRRSTLPITVRKADGTQLTEGKDFAIEANPKIIQCQGKISFPAGSAVKEGDVVTVDWYQLANSFRSTMPEASGCHKEYWDAINVCVGRLKNVFGDLPGFHICTGEWRVANWDPACIAKYGTSGPYMAGVTIGFEEALRKTFPNIEIFIKNDMYDPYHNAHDRYANCNGSLKQAWHGVSTCAVVINWRAPKTNPIVENDPGIKSLRFWAGQDPEIPFTPRRQMIRFNCELGSFAGATHQLAGLEYAEKHHNLTGVVGCVYNSWAGNYDGLEEMAGILTQKGRWDTNENPTTPYDAAKCKYALPGPRRRSPLTTPKGSFRSCWTGVSRQTRFDFHVPKAAQVRIAVYDANGRQMSELVDERLSAGNHSVAWNARGVASGIYLARLSIDGKASANHWTRKVILF